MDSTDMVLCKSLVEQLKLRIESGKMTISRSALLESFDELIPEATKAINEKRSWASIDSDVALLEAFYLGMDSVTNLED